MSDIAQGAHFEISHDGVVRTHRDLKETALESALYAKERRPTEDVRIRDLRDNSVIVIAWENGRAFVQK